jgi:5-formyltetrahydrofolate cyclo-ligase
MNIEPSHQLEKDQLRRQMRQRRAQIATRQRQAWDAAINHELLDHAARVQPRVVAAYLAFDGEPDLAPALEALHDLGVRLALPVVRETPVRSDLCFRQWAPGSDMEKNRYGIPEPMGTLDVRLDEIDLALIPLVAWDEHGGRLGMGASFYDRVFQPLVDLDRPFRMGVAYQLQQVERLPLDPWDIRLHGILTETGCLACVARNKGRARPA